MPENASELTLLAPFLEAVATPLIAVGPAGGVLDANEAFAALVGRGREQLRGARLTSLPLSFDGRGMLAALQAGPAPIRMKWKLAGGASLDLVWRCHPLPGPPGGLLCTVAAQGHGDAGDAHARAQRLESLATMAGAVAHDFNNVLTAVLGFAGLLKVSPALDAEAASHLAHLEQAARRGADVSGQLLAFARGGFGRLLPVDLREVVQDALAGLNPPFPARTRVLVALPPAPVRIEGDAELLRQALSGIFVNAREALRSEDAEVTVNLSLAGAAALLVVGDNGSGMTAPVLDRAVEPFFTTKPHGAGAGLGLAIAYGVVRGHRGALTVESAPGRGTLVKIELPLATERVLPDRPSSTSAGDLVLVVDDDDLARASISGMLGNLRRDVVEVASGPLALEVLGARPSRFAVVLLDLAMPGMNGRELFARIRDEWPDLPIVLISGFASDEQIDDEMRRTASSILTKPFDSAALFAAIETGAARSDTPT